MIQELLGSDVEERKISVPSNLAGPINGGSATSALSTPTSSSPVVTTVTVDPPLRCPRCNSPNTKFCYYNNYNLTQPRHFCKTCRRHWTKGGALRNVPIGGGCRKAKPSAITAAAVAAKSGGHVGKPNKPLSSSSTELGSRQVVWTASPQASYLLALLGGNTNIPKPNPNFVCVPEVDNPILGSPVMAGENPSVATLTKPQSLSLNPLGQTAISGPMLRTSNRSSAMYDHQLQPQVQIQSSNFAINGRCSDPFQALISSINSLPSLSSSSSSIFTSMAAAPPISAAATIEQISQLNGGEFCNYWTSNSLSWFD